MGVETKLQVRGSKGQCSMKICRAIVRLAIIVFFWLRDWGPRYGALLFESGLELCNAGS